jgi:hypothetical protein
MALGSGTGSEFRRPLGFAIIGGLLVSQVLTLFTTPVVYVYLDRVRRLFDKKQGAQPAARPTAPDQPSGPNGPAQVGHAAE